MRILFVFFALSISCGLFAKDVEILGSMQQSIAAGGSSSKPRALFKSVVPDKNITLLKIKLSADGQRTLLHRRDTLLEHNQSTTPSLYAHQRVQLGMNAVPVMNQGIHGTCATFAVTAAIDAALNKGDYISQLCLLQLGSYLEQYSYTPSGWNGSLGHLVLETIEMFGVLGKDNEALLACGDVGAYPTYQSVPKSNMSLMDYHQMSHSIDEQVGWTSILELSQGKLEKIDTGKVLTKIKLALDAGDRVTAGFLLIAPRLGVGGAVGSHKAQLDTWIFTVDILRELLVSREMGGHAMVITGYDDDAIAIDSQGQVHQGLLTLRNSWGEQVGDRGDFYMSYDYFKLVVLEAQRIRSMKE